MTATTFLRASCGGSCPAHVVLDEEHCFAFMDVMPQSPGHTLIVPRTAAETVFDLSDGELSCLIVTTRRVAVAVKAAFGPGGVMLMQLNGAGRWAERPSCSLPRHSAL